MKKSAALLVMLALCGCGLAWAQSFDLTSGRVPLASIDGLWRFHTGDNPAWADPKFDDSQWPLLRSDKNWSIQGYANYRGMAWYRFEVSVPAGLDHVALYLPRIRTCYEVYADGNLIGTFGVMRPAPKVYSSGEDHYLYMIPTGTREA